MIIIGCDFHPSFQQIAMLDTETGAIEDHKLVHASGELNDFIGDWRQLP
jgi:transposase